MLSKKNRFLDWWRYSERAGDVRVAIATFLIGAVVIVGFLVYLGDIQLPELKIHRQIGETVCDFMPVYDPNRQVYMTGNYRVQLQEGEDFFLFADETDAELSPCSGVSQYQFSFQQKDDADVYTAVGPGDFMIALKKADMQLKVFISGGEREGKHSVYASGLEWFDFDSPPEYLRPGIYQLVDGQDWELQKAEDLKTDLIGVSISRKFYEQEGIEAVSGSNVLIVHPDDEFQWITLFRPSDKLVIRIQIGAFGAPCGPIDPSCGARG